MSIDFRIERERLASLSEDLTLLLQNADLSARETEAGREALIEAIEDLRDMLRPEAAIVAPQPSDVAAGPNGLAIVVGHSAESQGAKGLSPPFPPNNAATRVDERHEYDWNTDLAVKIRDLSEAAGIRCAIFFRDGVGIAGAYRAVRDWGPEATVELHFNAANGRARGSLVLYGKEQSRVWAESLQKSIVRTLDRQGRTEDRGVFIPGGDRGYDRGLASVTQLHPSALIEPFFGDSPSDAALGVRRKNELARAVISAFGKFSGREIDVPKGGEVAEEPAGPTSPSHEDGLPDVALLRELVATYRSVTPIVQDLPPEVVRRLKGITLAQWIEESGWARSDLAAQHFNFAGMKALSEVDRILREAPATKVQYKAHDGIDAYLAFAGIRDFVSGYFLFLERSPYRGWKDMAQRSPHDFIRFIGRTWAQREGYASRVIGIEQRLVASGIVLPDGTLAETVAKDDTTSANLPHALSHERIAAEGATAEFLELAVALRAEPRLAPVLSVVVAQCALESNWGRSDLARVHANFAGIPWTDLLNELAASVPHPTDPSRGRFCRFLSSETFVRAYMHRLDNDPAFLGWTGETEDGLAFAGFLARTWRPEDSNYARKISDIVERIASGLGETPQPRTGDTPGEAEPRPLRAGLVLQVNRIRAEKRRGKNERTVGTYRLLRDGQPIAGLSGTVCESRGPGDNSATGKQRGARIKAGLYPLLTHAGSRKIDGVTAFKTIGYTTNEGIRKPPMPSLRVGNTKSRAGILIHPGNGWLWSIGCMNPSGDLADATSNITYVYSRKRVIALIDAMVAELGPSFPRGNNQTIPQVMLEVIGEPGPSGSDLLAGVELDQEAFARAELAMAQTVIDGDALAAPDLADLHDALATAMEAGARLGIPEDGAVDRIAASGVNLTDVRSATGATLWTPYALAQSAAGALVDARQREPVVARLDAIAVTLNAAGVPVDDGAAYHSAMTTAAIGNDTAALVALVKQGAPIDAFDRSGLTPLLAAAFNGAPDAARFLLEHGADPSRGVRAPVDLEEGDPELPPESADAAACAAEGAMLAADDPARLEDFEAVSALIWDALNPAPR